MEFYQAIAAHYDDLFPFKQDAATYILNSLSEQQKKDPTSIYVDIGCGTGSLAHHMGIHFSKSIGLDLNQGMIETARKKSTLASVTYYEENMLALETLVERNSVTAISCLGNTLPHLPEMNDVLAFLNTCFEHLQSNGKLFLQIINFDRILEKNIKHLPTLKKPSLGFERIYHQKNSETITFESILTTAEGKITSQVDLLILTSTALKDLIIKAGFSEIHLYGSYSKEPFIIDSMPLIIEATK